MSCLTADSEAHTLHLVAKVQALASDPKDGLAAALARLGRAMRLPSFDRSGRAGCCQWDLTLGSGSPHLLHSGKTHESRAMNAKQEAAGGANAENQGPTVRDAIPGEVAAITRLHEVNPVKALLGYSTHCRLLSSIKICVIETNMAS